MGSAAPCAEAALRSHFPRDTHRPTGARAGARSQRGARPSSHCARASYAHEAAMRPDPMAPPYPSPQTGCPALPASPTSISPCEERFAPHSPSFMGQLSASLAGYASLSQPSSDASPIMRSKPSRNVSERSATALVQTLPPPPPCRRRGSRRMRPLCRLERRTVERAGGPSRGRQPPCSTASA